MTMAILRVLAPYLWRLDDEPKEKQQDETTDAPEPDEKISPSAGEDDPYDIVD